MALPSLCPPAATPFAGVDQPVAGLETKRLALGAHLVLGAVREVRDLSVGESE